MSMSGDGMELEPDLEHYIALHSLRMSYTWNNIDAEKFNNNTLRYSKDSGVSWPVLTFADGNYTYSDISQYISNYLESQSLEKDSIEIYYTPALKKCFIELKNNFQVDFRNNLEFGALIGFNNLVTSSSYGSLTPDITNSVDNVIIRCLLIGSSILNGYQADSVLYMFNTSPHRIGYSITIDEKNMIYNKINTNTISKFNISFKDGLNRYIDLKDTEIQMVLFVRSF